MIVRQGNDIQYGVKYLVFDTITQFKAFTDFAAAGTKAYVIENSKTYILDSEGSWEPFEVAHIGMFVLKGVVSSAEEFLALSDYKSGNAYKATDSFYVSGLGTVNSGQILLAVNDGATFSLSDWIVLQNDLDVFIGATHNDNGSQGILPQPLAGQENYYLSGNGYWRQITADHIIQGSEELILNCGDASDYIEETSN